VGRNMVGKHIKLREDVTDKQWRSIQLDKSHANNVRDVVVQHYVADGRGHMCLDDRDHTISCAIYDVVVTTKNGIKRGWWVPVIYCREPCIFDADYKSQPKIPEIPF